MDKNLSVKDILGEWEGETPTGLVRRIRDAWDVPLRQLSDKMVITFLNQKIAPTYVILETERRLKNEVRDGSELFDLQLKEAFEKYRPN